MTGATISVALATYNGGRYLEEQLQSILAQDRPPAEIVVADDGSTDDTLAIVERMRAHAGTVTVRLLEPSSRLGVTANFERAIAACTGDLIALCDQDDVWHPARLRVLADALGTRPGLLLVHSDARIVDGAGEPAGGTLFGMLEVGDADLVAEESGDAFSVLLRRNLVTGATTLFASSLRELARPFPAGWLHDEWLAVIAAAAGGVTVVREALTDYRQHGANEVGVTEPTLRHKIARVLEPRGDRNRGLAERSRVLAERLAALPDVPAGVVDTATAKARVEQTRAAMPRVRLWRVPAVLRLALRGDYQRYTSRGSAEIVRDLLQPA